MTRDEERFWAKVERDDDGGCWVWTAGKTRGYGSFRVGPRAVLAHRFAYESVIGPVPDGLELDHLCRTKECVNPAHLEAVPHKLNVLRGTSPAALHAVKTHCPQGHAYSPENTYVNPRGQRFCRTCKRASDRARRAAA